VPAGCNTLLISPRFNGRSFWNQGAVCEVHGTRFPAAPLGLITVAALLPPAWTCRLVNCNVTTLTEADLDWADLVMVGGMLPQRPDALAVIAAAHARGKPVVMGGPDVTGSPEVYKDADFLVLGEAESVIGRFIAAWESGAKSGVFEAEKFKTDVATSPIPRFDLLRAGDYLYWGVQFSRGCPFTCEFCDIIDLYGRVPRTKSAAQMLAEIDRVYELGYRGHLDFVDDNFIGNKKAVKAFLPHLIAWQKAHDYPFMLSTEASINLADDDELLALMREANFFVVFVGIESPDFETLVSMQKKQNTRRVLAESVRKIYRAGMFVIAGFIVGFDGEKDGVADGILACIEATSIPVCMVGLLYALPRSQLTRRLDREGRLFPMPPIEQISSTSVGDQCTAGLNFVTDRPRRDILADYRKVLAAIYRPAAFYARVRSMIGELDRPVFDLKGGGSPRLIQRSERRMLWRLIRRMALTQPLALLPFARTFLWAVRENPRALLIVGMQAGLYLHVGPFSRFVIAELDRQIASPESEGFGRPPTPREIAAAAE
jgi:Domain of unknown function (DUF4070)/Radical SAM superfamily